MPSRYDRATSWLIVSRCFAVEAAITPRDREARDEPLDVPLEGPRERLVEVVEAEHDLAVGRREAAEVRQVRVAAELRVETRTRPAREIRGHQVGGTAVEGERRDEHPAVADRNELGHPGLRLLLEQLDGIRAVQGRLPLAVRSARDLGPRRLASRCPLGDGEVLDPGRRRGAPRDRLLDVVDVAPPGILSFDLLLIVHFACTHRRILFDRAHSSTLPFVSADRSWRRGVAITPKLTYSRHLASHVGDVGRRLATRLVGRRR